MLKKADFIHSFCGLCEIYNKKPSEYLIDIYYEIFKDYDLRRFDEAIKQVIMSNKYNVLPKPAEILEYLEGNQDDKAMIAWIKAKEGVKKCGYYGTPEFDDPIISHCIDHLGGWMEFCKINLDELCFAEKRFLDAYKTFIKRGIKEPTKLCGYIEQKNAEKGYQIPYSVKIGKFNQLKVKK